MKKEELFQLFGGISPDLVEEAERRPAATGAAGKKRALRRWGTLAACLVCAAGLAAGGAVFLPRLLEEKPGVTQPFQGAAYASLEEIPVERVGDYLLTGTPGLVELWESGGELYFSYITRWVEDSSAMTTVLYETAFRVNTADGSYIAVSEEVNTIYLLNGRFIYTREDQYLTGDNRWEVPYYTNSLDWNHEREISGREAEKLINGEEIRTGFAGGERVRYIATFEQHTDPAPAGRYAIRLNYLDGESLTIPLPINEEVFFPDAVLRSLDRVVGLADDKVYFTADYQDTALHHGLFSVGLDGEDLQMITHEGLGGSVGYDVYLEEDGSGLWFCSPGTSSAIIRLDTASGRTELVTEVEEYVWSFVKNDGYILCQVAGETAADPTELRLIPYE